MRPERVAMLVERWVRRYTRGVEAAVALRRREEIRADIYEHVASERAAGTPERRIARAVASRAARGVVSDLLWRRRQPKGESMRRPLARPVARIAVGVAVVLSLPLVGMLLSEDVVWSLSDFVLAGILLATVGAAIELAVHKAGNLPLALGIGTLGVAAGIVGESDDAPGLVLIGLLLLAGACAIGVRATQRGR
jgi:hypothetical protein